jgi:hypothetical protein
VAERSRSGPATDARSSTAHAPETSPAAPVETLFDGTGFRTDHYHRAYDIAPDGDRFLMVRRQGLVSELVLVVNWFEELKAKVGR